MTTFRRRHAFSTVGALLIVLAISPVTAPFSVLRFAGTLHRGASVLHSPGPSLRTGPQCIVLARNVDGRAAILRLTESPARFLAAAVDRESKYFAVLRI